jgi:hypothetical protein
MNKNKEQKLLKVINDIIWMAMRYANGSRTYAPGMIRDAVKVLKELYLEYKVRFDRVVIGDAYDQRESFKKSKICDHSDYLDDLIKEDHPDEYEKEIRYLKRFEQEDLDQEISKDVDENWRDLL